MAWAVSSHLRWYMNPVYSEESRTANKTPVDTLPKKNVYVVKNA